MNEQLPEHKRTGHVNIYSKDSLFEYENDILNKTMDHFGNSKKRLINKYRSSHSQKNLLTSNQMQGFTEKLRKYSLITEIPVPQINSRNNPKDFEISRLKKDLTELDKMKLKYSAMERKMGNLEKLIKSMFPGLSPMFGLRSYNEAS